MQSTHFDIKENSHFRAIKAAGWAEISIEKTLDLSAIKNTFHFSFLISTMLTLLNTDMKPG
jgi:hypothetical protein